MHLKHKVVHTACRAYKCWETPVGTERTLLKSQLSLASLDNWTGSVLLEGKVFPLDPNQLYWMCLYTKTQNLAVVTVYQRVCVCVDNFNCKQHNLQKVASCNQQVIWRYRIILIIVVKKKLRECNCFDQLSKVSCEYKLLPWNLSCRSIKCKIEVN